MSQPYNRDAQDPDGHPAEQDAHVVTQPLDSPETIADDIFHKLGPPPLPRH